MKPLICLAPQGRQGLPGHAGYPLDDGHLPAGEQVAQHGKDRREEPDPQIDRQFLAAHLFRPGRKQRHQQIHAQKHVHEPQMPGGIIEVEEQILEILRRTPPEEGVEDRPDRQRDQDSDGPAAHELPGVIAQREKQITGCNGEKGHAAADQRIEKSRPEGIPGRQDQRSVSTDIERFRTVYDHHHQAGDHPQPVQPDFAFLYCILHFVDLSVSLL